MGHAAADNVNLHTPHAYIRRALELKARCVSFGRVKQAPLHGCVPIHIGSGAGIRPLRSPPALAFGATESPQLLIPCLNESRKAT